MKKAYRMMLMVPEHALAHRQMIALETHTRHLYRVHFSTDATLSPVWILIPDGQQYNAGLPSASNFVSITVPNGTLDATRHAFMEALRDLWMRETGCAQNALILSVLDQDLSDQISQSHVDRIRPLARPYHITKALAQLAVSKISQGTLTLNINRTE